MGILFLTFKLILTINLNSIFKNPAVWQHPPRNTMMYYVMIKLIWYFVHQVFFDMLSSNINSRYSVQSLIVLVAERFAPLQDPVFTSQEKERVCHTTYKVPANVVYLSLSTTASRILLEWEPLRNCSAPWAISATGEHGVGMLLTCSWIRPFFCCWCKPW